MDLRDLARVFRGHLKVFTDLLSQPILQCEDGKHMRRNLTPGLWSSLWLKTGARSRCCIWVGYHVGGATYAVVWLQFQLHLKIEHCWLTNIPVSGMSSCSCSTSILTWNKHITSFQKGWQLACLASWSSISWGGIMKKSMTLMRMAGDSTRPFPGRDDHMGSLFRV